MAELDGKVCVVTGAGRGIGAAIASAFVNQGGRVAILDFGKPDGPIARALYAAYLGVAMPLVGWLFHGDADTYRYIPASLERYPGQRGVERLMREAGFENSRYENALLGTMGINLGEKSPRRSPSGVPIV